MVIAFSLLAAACSSGGDDGGDAATGEALKVAFVHVGPVADKGWSWAHDQGAQELKAALGDGVEITTLESIPEG